MNTLTKTKKLTARAAFSYLTWREGKTARSGFQIKKAPPKK